MYKVKKEEGTFVLIETETENVIEKNDDYDAIRKHYKFLKSGGGFAGWTPSFFLAECKIGVQ